MADNQNPYMTLANEDMMASKPAAQTSSDNPYMDMAQEDLAQAQQRLKGVLDVVSPVNPDQAAEAMKLSRSSGLPQDTVQANLDEVRRRERVRLLNAQKMMADSPVLARQLMDPNFAKIAHDEVGQMSSLEMAASYLTRSLGSGALNLTAAATKLANDVLGTPEQEIAALFKDDPAKLKEVLETSPGTALIRWAKDQQNLANQIMANAPDAVKAKYGNLEYFTTDTDNAAYLSPVKMMGDALQSLPTTLALMFSAYVTRGRAATEYSNLIAAGATREVALKQASIVAADTMAKFSALTEGMAGYAQQYNQTRADVDKIAQAQLEQSPQYQQLLQEGFTPESARTYLSAFTAQQAGTLAGIVDGITNFYGGKVLGRVIGEGGSLLPRLGKGFATEALTEMPQSMGEQFAQNLATQQNMNPGQSLSEGVGEAGAAGFFVGGLTGATFSGVFGRAQRDQEQAGKANTMFELLGKLNDMAAANKVRERDVDTFEGFLQSVENSQQGPVNTLYIEPRTLVDTLLAAGVNIGELKATLPSLAKLDESLQSGTELAIPVSEFASRMAGSDYAQALLPHLKTDPNGMSKVQADEYMQTHGEKLQAEVEKVLADAITDEKTKVSAENVRQFMTNELTATGYTKDVVDPLATLWTAFYTVNAARAGKTPEQFAAEYPPPFVNRQGFTGQTYDQRPATVKLDGRDVPVRMGAQDTRSGYRMVAVRADAFDAAYKASDSEYQAGLYVGPGGEGGIDGRYQRFGEFQKDAKFIEASTVGVDENGKVTFGNGRHRYAFMRDQGNAIIPVAMDEDSYANAVANGLVDEQASEFFQRGVQPAGRTVPTTVDAMANVEAAFEFAGSQSFPTNRDFKIALQERVNQAAKQAKVNLAEFSKATEEFLVRMGIADGLTALRTNANAVGWYNEKVTKALRIVSLIHPEVATDPQAKFAFVWALAVTSNGLKVDKNFELAEAAYEGWKAAGGVMPTDIGIGTAGSAIDEGLGLYNKLISKHGFETVEQFMTTMQAAGEVEKFTGKNVTGENKTTQVYGAAALGPKIGNGFFMNLYGRFEQLTMDRWLMRTWGRWTGTLVESNPAQVKAKREQLKALIKALTPADKKAFEAIIKRKLTVGDLDEVGVAIWKASQKKANRVEMAKIGMADEAGLATMTEILGEAKKGTVRVSFGDELRKVGNGLTKYLDGQKESPSGPPERGNIRKVFTRVLQELQKTHPALTMSDYQALLWYPEKRLYDAAKTADESVEGYEDDEAPDYANAAAKLARAKGISDADIAATLAAVDAELQAAISAAGVRSGERGSDAGAADQGQGGVNGQTTGSTYAQSIPGSGELRGSDGILAAAGGTYPRGDQARAEDGSLAGLPRTVGNFTASHFDTAERVARAYMAAAGLPYLPPNVYVKVDPARAQRIAAAFEEMPHDPQNPEVKAAYDAMIAETLAQYQAAIDAGLQVEFITGEDPYEGNPRNMIEDVRQNNHMWVFSTRDGFGSDATFDPVDNPLLQETEFEISGQKALANDIFRVVHDYFGHVKEGVGFRADGEENAWQAHMSMYSPLARRAATTETRGQNSWLNFGPYGETNRTAKVEDTHFADQKIGLLPEWVTTEGYMGGTPNTSYNQDTVLLAPNGKPSNLPPVLHALVRTPEFKAWFGDWEKHARAENPVGSLWSDDNVSKAVDENGEPLVVYHGTDTGGFVEFNTPSGTKRGDLGIFLTPNRSMAATYVKRGRGAEDITRDQTGEDADRVSGVYPLFVNIRNPLEDDFDGAMWNGEREDPVYEMFDANGDPTGDVVKTKEEADRLVDEGKAEGGYMSSRDIGRTTDSVVAEARGYNDGAIIRNVIDEGGGASSYAGEPSDVFVAFDPTQIKSVENFGTFNPNDPNIYKQEQDVARGKITFPAAGVSSGPSVITLFKSANLSTFLHESGHFFLEVTADMAAQPNAPKEIVDDMNAILRWFGVEDLQTWRAMDIEQKRPLHEKFARGFEAYLFEGRSPNLEMAGIFQRFRAWMLNVYKQIKALNVELDDEIRGVFDRMLASNDAILEAEQARKYVAMFTVKPPFMTDDEWRDYQHSDLEATQAAVDDLQTRSLRDMKWLTNAKARILKALQKDAAEKRKEMRREVEAEVMAEPVYRAMQFLKRGTIDGEPVDAPHKLSLPEIEELYKDNPAIGAIKKALGFGKYGMLAAENAVHPQQVAELFGFSSPDHLVRSLMEAPDARTVIEQRTDQRMLERYGDLNSPEALNRAADEAIHNEARAKFVATEANALAKATGRPKILQSAARAFAQQIINRLKIREIRPGQYAASAARAARNAAKPGVDLVEAATEKRNQLINTYAAKYAYDAQREIERGIRYLRKFDGKNIYKVMHADYVEQIHALLERFDLRVSTSGKDIEKRRALVQWVESERAKGNEPVVPQKLLDEAFRTSYKELSLEDFRGLIDTIRNIEHLGRLKDKLLKIQDQREFRATVAEASESINDNAYKDVSVERENKGIKSWVVTNGREILAWHRKFASLVRQMDGFKDGGPLWRIFVRPMNEAATQEASMREQAAVKLAALYKGLGKINLNKKTFIPEIGASLSLEGRLAVALNMGNETNMRRVMEGEGWNPAQVNAIVGTLTREQWTFVQGVWDLLNSYWPEISAKEKRMTGLTPEKVESRPFVVTLADGTQMSLDGGYYPIKYNPARSSKAEADTAAEVLKQMERGLYTRAQTARGHLESRVQSVNRPMRYDLGVIDQHLNQVIHDLSWHEYLVDANRLLRADPVDSAIREHYGPEVLAIMRKTMEDIAIGELPAVGTIERGVRWIRGGVSIAAMGWSLITAIQQPTGLAQSVKRIGAKWVAKGASRWLRDAASMENTVAWVNEKSEFMRLRSKTQQREISEIRNTIYKGETMSAVQGSFFYLIAKMQLVADMPTWLGMYEKAMAEGKDEPSAIALADQAVLDSQGGGQIKDLSQVQKGGEWQKLWTNFYSYFNVTYNLLAESVNETRKVGPSRLPLLAIDVLMLTMVPATLGLLIKAAVKGALGDDDDEELAKKLVAENLSYLMGTMIGLRELNAVVSGSMGYEGPAGARFFADVAKFAKQVEQGEADEAFFRAANDLGGVLLHYPASQIDRTVRGVIELSEGNQSNPLGLLFGPAPKK